MKKFFIVLVLIIAIAAGAAYFYRYDILQYSVESIVKNNLPSYLSIRDIDFDFDKSIITMKDISIRNPNGYLTKFFVKVDACSCRYRRTRGGIEITEIVAEKPVINIERGEKGKVNLTQMAQVVEAKTPGAPPAKEPSSVKVNKEKTREEGTRFDYLEWIKDSLFDRLKLTAAIEIKHGEVFFLDYFLEGALAKLRVEDINGVINIKLSGDFQKVLSLKSTGDGFLNGDRSQRLGWKIFLDPTGERIKMSNTCLIENVDMTIFEPYYDKFSPIKISSGRCSGTLVFNFDGNDIGSTNELRIRNLKFREKSGDFGFKYWQVSAADVIKYLQSSTGEIIFDFKIKGNIDDPRFYPGPHLKAAMRNMVVNKVTDAIGSFTEEGDDSDVGKVIDIMKGILNK